MNELLKQLSYCIERGKIRRESPYPPDMKDEDGAYELTLKALESKIPPAHIFQHGLTPGMDAIGKQFGEGEVFIPDLLMSAEAMKAAMEILEPYFTSGEAVKKGKIALGTVAGDIHAIGKNIVKMVLEGDGWEVIDLGVDVTVDRFSSIIEENSIDTIGMSALLTSSMLYMSKAVKELKQKYPTLRIYIGGAPVTQKFNDEIGADGYFPEPHSLVKFLRQYS